MARGDVLTLEHALGGGQGGSADGLFELGLIYSTGRDVACDLIAAHKWFNLAALRGNHAAKEYRSELAREMTKAQVAEAQRQAREWLSGR